MVIRSRAGQEFAKPIPSEVVLLAALQVVSHTASAVFCWEGPEDLGKLGARAACSAVVRPLGERERWFESAELLLVTWVITFTCQSCSCLAGYVLDII